MSDKKEQLIIFDLDDTLVDTSHVYWVARTQFIDLLTGYGLDPMFVLEEFEEIDDANIRAHGFIPERYALTMLDTYQRLVHKGMIFQSTGLEDDIRECGRIVFDHLPELIDGRTICFKWAH